VIAEKIGLVVITLERYFKIVHAILHRKYYRKWMTTVGVAMPWISGFCTFAIPAIATTKLVAGRCPMMGFWTSEGARKVSITAHNANNANNKHYCSIY